MWTGNSDDAVVDVLIVTYNHPGYLRRCVESVINQEFQHPYNIFVYDDHSSKRNILGNGTTSDSPRQVLWGIRDKLGVPVEISRENRGVCLARNRMFAERSKAPFILFVDGDDYLDPDFLEMAWRKVNVAQASVVYPKAAIFSDAGMSPHGVIDQIEFDLRVLMRRNYIPVTSLMRREVFKKVGGFDEDFVHGLEDWNLWISAALAGVSFAFEPKAILYYRHHSDARSHTANARQDDIYRLIKEKHAEDYDRLLKPAVEEVDDSPEPEVQ